MDFQQNKYYIIGGVVFVVAIIIGLVLVLGRGFGQATPKNVTLQFWGVFDSNQVYEQVIRNYTQQVKNVHIIYKQLDINNYEKELIDSFASGTGPDIWLTHNTWLPKHFDKIAPLPQEIQKATKAPLMTFKDFQEQFVDVTVADLTGNGLIYALPLYVDTLALYWNKDIFNNKEIASPPRTWDEFNEDVVRLTSFDGSGNITLSGAAVGTAKNINRSTDLLSLLMIQSGTQMTNQGNSSATFSRPVQNKSVGESALQYYTDFANPSKQLYAWNNSSHYSIDAFQESRAAMMFNYSHNMAAIKQKSPRLNFAIAPMPQFSDSQAVNYANYWAPTVSKASPNALEAWKFLTYLTSRDQATFYLNASRRPAARRDLIDGQKDDPDLGVFARQALTARSWYQIDSAAIESILAGMIEDVILRRISIRDALQSAENKVSVLMVRAQR